jgi:hypothetical protein
MLVVVLVDGKMKTQKKMTLLSSTYCLFAIRNTVTPAARSSFRIPHFLPRIFCLPWQPANQCDGYNDCRRERRDIDY